MSSRGLRRYLSPLCRTVRDTVRQLQFVVKNLLYSDYLGKEEDMEEIIADAKSSFCFYGSAYRN